MRREQIDMWVVICREHNEDPVYTTLVPAPSLFAWRLTMLVFFDRGEAGIERLIVNRYGSGDLHKAFADYYTPAFEPENLDPWQRLARIVAARNPKKIAVDESDTFAFADGLTATHKSMLLKALDPEYARRIVSGGRLTVGWLERRSAEELAFYPTIVALNHLVVAEAFSNRAITPGVTTIDDLAWRVRERIAELKLGTWFQPMFYIVRSPASTGGNPRVVQRGDLLRCDIGITYLGLAADIQQVAYVLRPGETDAPKGLRDALAAGNRLQDILVGEMKPGLSGNAILASALSKARAAGLNARIYSHPIGYHGHAAGSRIGLPDMQDGVPGMGDYPVYGDTCWAIELGVRVPIPEWDNLEISMALEEDAAVTAGGVKFLDGRQTRIHLIR
jgi:Xaa-Pro aminopeptidase